VNQFSHNRADDNFRYGIEVRIAIGKRSFPSVHHLPDLLGQYLQFKWLLEEIVAAPV
jgi:hypothetical protein